MGLFNLFGKKKKVATKAKSENIKGTIDSTKNQTLKQRDSFIRNGFEQYEFIANTGCCEKCAQLNGKHFPVKELKIGENAPPMHEGCRCSIAAYSDRREYDEWLDSISSGGKTKK